MESGLLRMEDTALAQPCVSTRTTDQKLSKTGFIFFFFSILALTTPDDA